MSGEAGGSDDNSLPSRDDPTTWVVTPRLILRTPVYDDAYDLHAAIVDPTTSHFFPTLSPRDARSMRVQITEWYEKRSDGLLSYVIVPEKMRCKVVGLIQIGADQELGLFLASGARQRGYASEAVAALIKVLGLTSVWCISDVENLPLLKLLAKFDILIERRLESYRVHPRISTSPRDCFIFRQRGSV